MLMDVRENVTFLSLLPQEIIEKILVELVAAGSPESIASLSETCKLFHALIYRSSDHHLWREIFLTTFDDTRTLLAWLKSATPTACTVHGMLEDACLSIPYPWDLHFKRRIQSARIYKSNGPSCDVDTLRIIIAALLSPFPLDTATLEINPESSLYPPITSSLSIVPPSKNIRYVNEVLGPGLPLDAASEILQSKANNIQDYIDQQLPLFKLAFLVGFEPKASKIPRPDEVSAGRRLEVEETDRMAARTLAQRKVYDMRYPTVEQCWGPFILLTPLSAMSAESDEPPGDDGDGTTVSEPTPSSSSQSHPGSGAVHIGPPISFRRPILIDPLASDEDTEDEGEFDPMFEDDEDSSDGEDPVGQYIYPATPHRLIPDYSWLSAARFLIECNLHGLADSDWEYDHGGGTWGHLGGLRLIESFKNLDLLRMGGVPGFWERGWKRRSTDEDPTPSDPPHSPISPTHPPASRLDDIPIQEHDLPCAGWDWAGVEGKWLRTVSWIGYPDLIHHNRHLARGSARAANIEEQVGIFAMTLQVTGYMPPPPVPAGASLTEAESFVYRVPIIQVEGESLGSDHHPSEQRVLTGTIRMIGDGSVRWSMKSRIVGTNRTEWVTEGVQIGSIGSGLGVIGLWTGPEHHSSDPLGPWWMWKVSDTAKIE